MSFFDAVFGRTRLRRPQFDPLFRLSAAAADVAAQGLHPGRRAGLCCRAGEEAAFAQAWQDASDVTALYAKEHGLAFSTTVDREGYRWSVVEGDGLDDLVTALHATADTLGDRGFGGSLLAAVFRMEDSGGPTYLIYNYKRGRFYPFHPTGAAERDDSREIQISTLLRSALPIEDDLDRWYPLWDCPV